jgi:Tfp pilus assembly protein PilO
VTAKLNSLSPRALALLAGAAVLLYAVAVWFVFVSPNRADAARAKEELAAAELELAEAQAAAHRPDGAGVPVSEVLRLAKAMPASADQAGLVLELTRLAEASGLGIRGITPQAAALGAGGATLIPVAVAVEGRFRQIQGFLRRARTLVTVRDGRLRARGRLFIVQDLALTESVTDEFPTLDATITLHAYVYDGPIAPVEIPGAEEEEELEPSGGNTAAGSTD